MKGNVGSKLHPEIDTLVKQWLYRMWTPCSGADDVYLKKQKNTQVLQRKWNKRSTVVLQEEIAKNNEVVCRRMSESQKKGTKAQNIEKTRTKWIRHGWKNRRRSVSRLPCSLLTVYWFGHIYNLDLRLAVSSSSLQVLFNFFQQLLELNAAGPPSDQGHHPGRNCVFFEVVK